MRGWRRVVFGVDPGVTGAISMLVEGYSDEAEDEGEWNSFSVWDLPGLMTKRKRSDGRESRRRTIDLRATGVGVVNALAELEEGGPALEVGTFGRVAGVHCILEEPKAMGGMGSISNYSKGHSVGALKMLFVTLGIEVFGVAPVAWKDYFGLLKKEKADSVALALELLPAAGADLKLKKHHDRAEALLLALYGRGCLDRIAERDQAAASEYARLTALPRG